MADMMGSSPKEKSATMNGSPGIPGVSAKTSHETKRRYQSLPRSSYKLTVQETV